MDLRDKYAVYVGSVRGILFHTNLDGRKKVHHEALPDDNTEITAMIWGRNDSEIMIGSKSGRVTGYDAINQKFTSSNLLTNGSIIGLGCLNESIIAASNDGTISLLGPNQLLEDVCNVLDGGKGTLDAFRQDPNRSELVAVGGEDNELKLWNLATNQCVFKGKSLGHDSLNLPIKNSIRDVTFCSENVCCAVSKEGHALLYDERVQRKPIMKFHEPKASFTCCLSTNVQRNVLVGTTKGYIQYVDMKNGKCMKTFTNVDGSVKSLGICNEQQLVFAVSLDRHLRLFDLNTKETIFKQYLKQNLTKVLLKSTVKIESYDEMDF